MGSRIRDNPTHIFECFCEVGLPSDGDESAWVLQKFPEDYNNEEILKSIPQFSYPCHFTPKEAVEHFSFVLTSVDSKWTFGYCRYAPNTPTCFVMLSYLPWHDTFFRVLNNVAELTNNKRVPVGDLWKFLEALYNANVPKSGMQLHVSYNLGQSEFVAQSPDDHKLPSIPQNRNLMEYFSAISINNMICIFASMLHERRILITSKKLSKLSACVQAANLLIYPMFWQHIFIPVLPNHLLDYLSAPMPFLIGVPTSTFSRVRTSEIGEVVVLDADKDKVETPFNDVEMMPTELIHTLKRGLKNPNCLLGDTVSRAFLRAVVQLIGGYKEALDVRPGVKITFNREIFIKSRPPTIQPFLEKMLHLQLFHQFIEGRLQMYNANEPCSDEFESEVNLYEDKSSSRFKVQYKEWAVNMKKEGGALLKSVKNKANPAMKHAYKSVKHKGRKAYKEFRSKIHDIQHQKDGDPNDISSHQRLKKPHSAPASPILSQRSFTIHNPDVIPKSQTTGHHLEASAHNITRHYNLLELEDHDTQSDTDSSPNLSMDRLNLDLMSDFEDIFQSCSLSSHPNRSVSPKASTSSAPITRRELSAGFTSLSLSETSSPSDSIVLKNPPPIDRRLKPQRSGERSLSTPPIVPSPVKPINIPSGLIKPMPIPPPRSKRRTLESYEAPLINLDDNEPIFDPLLEKDVTNHSDNYLEQPDLLIASNGKTIWQPRQQLSFCHTTVTRTGPITNWPAMTQPMQANPVYFVPPMSQPNPHNPFLPASNSAQATSSACYAGRWTKLPDSNIWCNLSNNENS